MRTEEGASPAGSFDALSIRATDATTAPASGRTRSVAPSTGPPGKSVGNESSWTTRPAPTSTTSSPRTPSLAKRARAAPARPSRVRRGRGSTGRRATHRNPRRRRDGPVSPRLPGECTIGPGRKGRSAVRSASRPGAGARRSTRGGALRPRVPSRERGRRGGRGRRGALPHRARGGPSRAGCRREGEGSRRAPPRPERGGRGRSGSTPRSVPLPTRPQERSRRTPRRRFRARVCAGGSFVEEFEMAVP